MMVPKDYKLIAQMLEKGVVSAGDGMASMKFFLNRLDTQINKHAAVINMLQQKKIELNMRIKHVTTRIRELTDSTSFNNLPTHRSLIDSCNGTTVNPPGRGDYLTSKCAQM